MAGIVEGKVVVVTGGGRGIGREIALLMAREGAKVVVNDIGTSLGGEGSDQTPAGEVVAEIKKNGGAAVASYDSVAEWDSAHRIVQTAVDTFGRIDCVVNNAGILRDIIFHKMTFEDFDSVVKVMLYGAFNMSRAAAPHFRQQNGGAFVHMTSNSGMAGNIGQANYGAAKAGMIMLSKHLALDMQRFNVRSNAVAPSAWTRMTGSIPSNTPDKAARVAQRQAVTPDKNAPLVVYLASDAAKDVNGQVFYTRKNEIFLMSQMRPKRGIHRAEGWTPQSVAEHAIPALKADFYPLERNQDVFSWDPI
ncbi:MAG: 3-hydroxyacyl-CoA dehydrogenase [Betaproteobacteria bacterium]|nr:3-hydroxyacyl-CoA dehydrogenase [Betaproteobacteria bacterium]